MSKKAKVKIKRVDGFTQYYWVTKRKIKEQPFKYAKYELWKDGTLRRVVRNNKGHFVTWEIIEVTEPTDDGPIDWTPWEPEEPEEEYQTYRVDFDIRFEKES